MVQLNQITGFDANTDLHETYAYRFSLNAPLYAAWRAIFLQTVIRVAKTTRLDLLLLERGLFPSRQVAQAAIMDGGVLVNGQKITKPGNATKTEANIELVGNWARERYVSRGGLKLERALEQFNVATAERICLDLGASTGGFTDCLLKRGAALVYAIDVGYGQLDWTLRNDSRVVVRERTNARHLTPEALYGEQKQRATLAVADLSFISLTKILPAAIRLLEPESDIVALIKPQFEAGRHAVGKGGVVRSKEAHETVLRELTEATASLGLQIVNITYSPIKGPAGNIEFLGHWHTFGEPNPMNYAAVVEEAHSVLNG